MSKLVTVTTWSGERFDIRSDARLTEAEIARHLGKRVSDLRKVERSFTPPAPKKVVVVRRSAPVDDLTRVLDALTLGVVVEEEVDRRGAKRAVNRSGRSFVYVANSSDKRGVYHSHDECCARSDPRRRGNILVHDKISLDRAENEYRQPCTRCW